MVLLLLASCQFGPTARGAFAPAALGVSDENVALVLATDVSRSIDDSEFNLEKQGYAGASASQAVIGAIQDGPAGAVGVASAAFAGSVEMRTVPHWTVIRGDGTSNAGREITEARDDALKAGIAINGLAIVNDHPVSWTLACFQAPGGLPDYDRKNVTGGPGGFVLEVHDFHRFGEAMTRKPVTGIAGRAGPSHLAALH
ncbi:MAG TPA: DUF1194 domain-containing protein [Acetobacteraceae bacterium]|nr:DUF1194 domain-containing protein [Acetobacteraceae bacterium]